MGSLHCNSSGGDSSEIPWSFGANWIIAHGSLESSVAVESSDHPIADPDQENLASKSPLILKPRGSDSGPCEIKSNFRFFFFVFFFHSFTLHIGVVMGDFIRLLLSICSVYADCRFELFV